MIRNNLLFFIKQFFFFFRGKKFGKKIKNIEINSTTQTTNEMKTK